MLGRFAIVVRGNNYIDLNLIVRRLCYQTKQLAELVMYLTEFRRCSKFKFYPILT